jgi:hypothetical protein
MLTSHDVVACARAHIGVRFAHQGRGADGLDCLGLLLAVAQQLRLNFGALSVQQIDIPDYGLRPDTALLQSCLSQHLWRLSPADSVQPADIVLLKVDGSPRHLAFLSDYPFPGERGMIHAYAPAHQVVEHRYDRHWQRATHAAYRLPMLMTETSR